MPFNTCLDHHVSAAESQLAWQSLGDGEVFVTREDGTPFKFAAPTPVPPTLKADAELLYKHPRPLARLLGLFIEHPCITEADAVSFVPNGPADFARWIGEITGKPLIALVRPDGAARDDLSYRTGDDRDRAAEASSVCMIEDISRTGFSAHVTAALLRSTNPDLNVHTLSMLQRDQVEPRYQNPQDPASVVYHTLVRRDLPLTLEVFQQQFPDLHVGMI